MELLAFISLPLCGIVFRVLPDRGYGFSKALGWLLTAWCSWILASTPVVLSVKTQATIAIVGLTLLSGSALLHRRGRYFRAWLVFFRELRGYVIGIEAVFLLAFLALTLLRGYAPEIEGTEKPMEFMYLQAALLSPSAPPRDLWFSGYTTNYYYFGFYANAFLARLAGVAPGVAFNLSLAATWSATLAALWGLGYNVLASWTQSKVARQSGAVTVPLLVLLVGNPASTLASAEALRSPDTENFFGLFWKATRVVYDRIPGRQGPQETINEFPAASFLLGDLHPHVMSMPLMALGLGASLSLALYVRRSTSQLLLSALLAGAIGGLLYMTNSWDLPLHVALAVASPAVGLGECPLKRLRASALILLPVLVGVIFTALLFTLEFDAPVNRNAHLPPPIESLPIVSVLGRYVGVVWWDHTDALEVIRMWGIHLILFASVLVGLRHVLPRSAWVWSFLAGVVALVVALLLGIPMLVLIPMLLLCAWGAWTHPLPAVRWAFLAATAGWALVLLPEFVYVRDVFENRMNTAFKFYYQAWQLLGVSGAVLIVSMLHAPGRTSATAQVRRLAYPSLAVLLIGSLLFAYAGTRIRASGGYVGLNGVLFLQRADPDAFQATQWLRDNSQPSDVILEATGGPYSLYSRLATYSGRPTVLGWANHERQWRAGQPELLEEVSARSENIVRIYGEATPDERQGLLHRYAVSYVYYGRMEREMQAEAGLPVSDPFRHLLRVAWRGDTGTLYVVEQPS